MWLSLSGFTEEPVRALVITVIAIDINDAAWLGIGWAFIGIGYQAITLSQPNPATFTITRLFATAFQAGMGVMVAWKIWLAPAAVLLHAGVNLTGRPLPPSV